MPLSSEEMKKLFSTRLSDMMQHADINQVELSRILGVSESTVGKWILCKSMPRMGIIQKIADYFHVGKSYFLEETSPTQTELSVYYTDPEVVQIAEELRTDPNRRILFDASKDLNKDDIDTVLKIIDGLKARDKE